MNFDRGPHKPWHAEEDARLLRMIDENGKPIGDAGWRKVAEDFYERSPESLRQRFLTLRNREKRAAVFAQRRALMQEPIIPKALPEHTSLTAAVFGDPLPGRSALDEKRAQTS